MASLQHPHPLSANVLHGGLFEDEYLWRDHQEWLEACGYTLQNPNNCEDGQSPLRMIVMDAVCMSDNHHPQEEEIIRYFSIGSYAKDPSNHSIPVYKVLQSPHMENIQFLIMLYLIRLHDVQFTTMGEIVDIHVMNVMMDPGLLFSEWPHPIDLSRSYDFRRKTKEYTRTGHPTSYYYIDFGLSYKFPLEEHNPLVEVAFRGDKSVPEYKDAATPKDPYKIDVYCFSNLIQEGMIEQVSGLDFLQPLVKDMIDLNLASCPSIDVACERLKELSTSLLKCKLRSHVMYQSENPIVRLYRDYHHVFWTLFWIATQTPAIPSPMPVPTPLT
ncbi:hypothetical protein V8D89_007416 [Ganoderma adspersum]